MTKPCPPELEAFKHEPADYEQPVGRVPWTPGPWAPFWDDIPHSDIGEGWAINSPEHSIAVCDGPAAVNEANARLIAAAPALYEALIEARPYVQNVWEAAGDEFTRRKLAVIDEALALARGEATHD